VSIDKSPRSEKFIDGDPKPKPKSDRNKRGALLGLLVGLGGLVTGRMGLLWIGFDVFAQFTLQFAFLVAAMSFALVAPRFKSLIGIVLFATMISAYALWPQLRSHSAETVLPNGSQRLRVASFNTYINNLDFKAMNESILGLNADIVTLVEFTENKQPLLDSLRSAYPFQENCFALYNCDAAIISKYPLFNARGKGNWKGAPLIQASLGAQFGGLTVFGIHTTRFPHSRSQFKQVKEVAKLIETVPGRVIVMGDFNATPFSRVTQTVVESLGLNRLTNLPTFPADIAFPQLAIDHIFVSPDIVPLSSEVIGNSGGSDHFPVAMTVAVPQN
jgi:endonuclease/exonuclease/phosphatase (EEP) superfamily protein YafD